MAKLRSWSERCYMHVRSYQDVRWCTTLLLCQYQNLEWHCCDCACPWLILLTNIYNSASVPSLQMLSINTTVPIAILYKVLCWFGEHSNLTYGLTSFGGTCKHLSWGESKTRLRRGAETKPTCTLYICKTWHKHWNMLTTGLTHLILPKNNAFV